MKTYTKFNVSESEYLMYRQIQNLGIVNIPELIWYDQNRKIMTTRLIDSMNIADQYSDDAKCVPNNLYREIVDTINALYNNNIIYPDITGYNFIYDESDPNDCKLWIIDFEHAVDIKFAASIHTDFVKKFTTWQPNHLRASALKQWNPFFT